MALRLPSNRTVLLLALIVAGAAPFVFSGVFAGDAEVHLVFMENASAGRFFEFNPGEAVSGDTSPGYMMLGAAFFRWMPASVVPIALKASCLLAWYMFCWFVYRMAARLLEDERGPAHGWSAAAAFIAATLPGSVYNANAGMENGLFAAVVWGWVLLADRGRWFDAKDGNILRELAGGALLGLSCWLRPEGALVAIVAYAFRLMRVRPRFFHWLPGALMVAVVGGASIAFQYAFTGDLIATSILSRRVLAMPNLVPLGFIAVDPSFAERLLVYFPLTALFVWGLRAESGPVKSTERFLQLLFAVFLVIYSLAGTPQLARYVIFLMPILVIGALRGARTIFRRQSGRSVLAIAAIAMIVLDLGEAWYRSQRFDWSRIRNAMAGPATRHEKTDKLLLELDNPAQRPVIVATESVQIRYELDDRIIVRSLDGRVDRTLLRFAQRGLVDHVGYLQARRVDYLLQTKNYNRERSAWSLIDLRPIEAGQTLRRGGVSFRRLTSTKYAITMQ